MSPDCYLVKFVNMIEVLKLGKCSYNCEDLIKIMEMTLSYRSNVSVTKISMWSSKYHQISKGSDDES